MKPGTITFAKPDPTVGREQTSWRPVLVVSSAEYAHFIPGLVIAVPLTTRDRGLPHHVSVTGEAMGLKSPTWALSEQVCAVSTDRLRKPVGECDQRTLVEVRSVLRRFLDL
ncbi:type II toxin-antitoxin system PemK/MazF family toxin [Saccharopolyspora sp. K220]|uniref:type II toxin-antitoxin system PemK/MazF family toxin n=1 Tax=Saccharopolyspora soli TaxID=2926618 RepID=UPI001F596983|nr:type II toxin-antitoxin system PemK/MazF family toxin [Saccharopolyspora soli]MCI2416285.1 type II toxin-antitoxin system PemK/MazF family toxin [Saccharopolyspora soli]